jgi:general secretion pathway protein A
MYESFFGLKVKPFELLPNPSFFYQSRSHRKARNYLRYGLNERAGFILLTGEVGSGKTTLIRDLIASREDDIVLALLFNTKATTKQVLAMINEDFGLPVTGRDKVALLRDLNDFLLEQHAQNKRPVLIIDEAQNLSAAGLEEIRLLSNLEANNSKLLQIVMVGQTELKLMIAKHELRQLRQRISVHCHLEPLTRDETEDYIYYRLEIAGNHDAVNWREGTFDVLYQCSQGIPRLINVFCDFILLAAYVEGVRDIEPELVTEVIGDTSWDQRDEADQLLPDGGAGGLKQNMVKRLMNSEQKATQLKELGKFKADFSQIVHTVENLLRCFQEQQQEEFRRLEARLEVIQQAVSNNPPASNEATTSVANSKPRTITQTKVAAPSA